MWCGRHHRKLVERLTWLIPIFWNSSNRVAPDGTDIVEAGSSDRPWI
jgi:hypothetical protein